MIVLCLPARAQSFEGHLESGDARTLNAGPFDTHSISIREFQQVYARVSSSAFRSYLLVEGPDGKLIERPVPTSAESFFDVEYFAHASGIWKFHVTSPDPAALGAYRLDVAIGPPPIQEIFADSLSPGDARLVKGEWVDQHERTWTPSAPFNLSLTTEGFCGFVLLLSPAGQEYRAADPCADGRPAERVRVDDVAPETGGWKIFVTSAGLEQRGRYRVTLSFPRLVDVNR